MKVQVRKNLYRVIHPKHTYLVTSQSKDGKGNVCSVAWACPVSHDPPLVMIALRHRHKTTANINETGVFAINVPTYELKEEVAASGETSGWDTDKLETVNLTFNDGKIGVPVVEECIGWIECSVRDRYRCGDHIVFVGEVITAMADEKLWKDYWDDPPILLHYGSDRYGIGRRKD
ncbi:MAG TPA: flavin reductase family protein [bacterium (Candidatus Stahlbacteria)]|nr:flavin reductase family protein [Candidatus Stahlbacteria bacterium]